MRHAPPRPDEGPQQHDLSQAVAERMVSGARLRPGTRVLDAGAGLGAISAALLDAGAEVTAVEFDADRIAALRKRFAGPLADGRMTVVAMDLRRWKPRFTGPWRVVANPPFHLTAELVRGWVLAAEPPDALDLVLQHEAAEKLSGDPGRQTRSSALLACAGEATFVARLQRDATSPPSRVDLAVWRFRRAPGVSPAELARIDKLLTLAFAGAHSVAEALRGVASAIQLRRQGAEHGWDPRSHPRTLPPTAWPPLAALLGLCGKI